MKKVLIVENDVDLLALLQRRLEESGFETYSASNVAAARQLAELHWAELDVLILDILLEDPNEPDTKGADIAIEFRRRKDSFPPESLIYSLQNEIDYYRLALTLGAAAYLLKTEANLAVVVQHVRVLALRRALNGENPKIATEVARIAVHSGSQAEAIQTFCRRVLKPEFEACLGAPFVILFTEDNTTQNCADNADLPTGSSAFYHTLQALAHGKGNLTEPFFLETSELDPPVDEATALLYEKLNFAAFLPLSLSSNLKLSIGILRQERKTQISRPTYEETLCTLLAQYLRPTVLENVMNIWSQWTELRATRASTAKLCLSLGQEINDGLEATEGPEQLEDLADDLNKTGQLLIQLERGNWQGENTAISFKEVVDATWKLVAPTDNNIVKLVIQGDCPVHAQRSDLEIIISRLLQWFVYRSKVRPLDVEPLIKIKCEATNNGATITFEDTSHRLPPKLREDMFAPFTQAISTPFADIERAAPMGSEADGEPKEKNPGRYLPLYLAKMLVEGRYHGLLEDHSNAITEHSYGHLLLMQFPAASKTS